MSKKKAEKSGYNKTGYSKIEIILMLFLQSMKADVEDYCDLETVSDEHTFVTKTGAMITIIEYKGIKSLIVMKKTLVIFFSSEKRFLLS